MRYVSTGHGYFITRLLCYYNIYVTIYISIHVVIYTVTYILLYICVSNIYTHIYKIGTNLLAIGVYRDWGKFTPGFRCSLWDQVAQALLMGQRVLHLHSAGFAATAVCLTGMGLLISSCQRYGLDEAVCISVVFSASEFCCLLKHLFIKNIPVASNAVI